MRQGSPRKDRTIVRNGIVRALIEQGNVGKLAGRKFAPKKGKGAKYDRKAWKRSSQDE